MINILKYSLCDEDWGVYPGMPYGNGYRRVPTDADNLLMQALDLLTELSEECDNEYYKLDADSRAKYLVENIKHYLQSR